MPRWFDGRSTRTSRQSETRLPSWHQPSVRILTLLPRAATSGIVADLLVETDACIDHLEGAKRLPRRVRLAHSLINRAGVR